MAEARPLPRLLPTASALVALWFRLLGRRIARRGGRLALALGLLGWALAAAGLGYGTYRLFAWIPSLPNARLWTAFFLSLALFLGGLFWILLPVVAAQVDDAHELGRFLHLPIRPRRLYAIFTCASLAAPSSGLGYATLTGMGLGLSRGIAPGAGATIALLGAYALLCVVWGRAMLNLSLNVLTSRRAGVWLGGLLAIAVGLALLVPPVDTSWLTARLEGFGAEDPSALEPIRRAAAAMTDTPLGWAAHGLRGAANGHPATAVSVWLGLLLWAGLGWWVGLVALQRFHRGSLGLSGRRVRRPGDPTAAADSGGGVCADGASMSEVGSGGGVGSASPAPKTALGGRTGARLGSVLETLGLPAAVAAVAALELRSLARSPKGRMLFVLPLFLVVLLRLVGAAGLLAYLGGPRWTALLLGAIAVYGVASLGGQWAANAFGHDGPAVAWVFASPSGPQAWLLGRNLAHALYAFGQLGAAVLFTVALLPGARLAPVSLWGSAFVTTLLGVLAAGNLLSALAPRRYHFSLARRDRPSPLALLGLSVGLGSSGALLWALGRGAAAVGLPEPVGLGLAPVVAGLGYAALVPVAARLLWQRREAVIESVARA